MEDGAFVFLYIVHVECSRGGKPLRGNGVMLFLTCSIGLGKGYMGVNFWGSLEIWEIKTFSAT